MIGYLPHPLPYRFPIQPADLRHARDPSTPHLLSLEGGEQPTREMGWPITQDTCPQNCALFYPRYYDTLTI
jgi:hypothetical protein